MAVRERADRRRRGLLLIACCIVAASVAIGSGRAGATGSETLGLSTVEQRVLPNADADFRELSLGAGEPYAVREDGVGSAQAGRDARRTSLTYFGQLSDFQLADEESPARVEFIDTGPFSAAWRPSEAMNPQIDDEMIKQLNSFSGASPIAGGDGTHRAMDFTIDTGDSADSQQRNEVKWVRTLLDGGQLDPGSGINPASSGDPACAALSPAIADASAPGNYTGVQDYSDYVEGSAPQFYDPNTPAGAFASWPQYPGLMDRAQQPFQAAGLAVPSYVSFGNHDALVQGNAAANSGYESVATGCVKPISPVVTDPGSFSEALGTLDPASLQGLLGSDPTKVALVPPDPARQYVSKKQYKQILEGGTQTDGHGFGLIDPVQEAASNGAAGYYSWNPVPGVRFIALDTVSEAGVVGPSADGNIDDPQYQWLRGQLDDATTSDELVVLFSHHAIPSLTADVADEMAPSCTTNDNHGHDVQPGCDLDPRGSSPIHLGADMTALLHQYPHVIAWVAGHSHVNSIEPYPGNSGGGFWSVRVAAEADWPQQSRLLELFDNRDGTLSLFGTIIDHASGAAAPAAGTNASGLDESDLASIGRTLAYNDTQAGARACNPDPCGEGQADDRNVELLIDDPRTGTEPEPGGTACKDNKQKGTDGDDVLKGTAARDRLIGLRGSDRLLGRQSADCLNGGKGGDTISGSKGNDRIHAGKGRDAVRGGRGHDRLGAGKGRDQVRGGRGNDRIGARDRRRDVVHCGPGKHDRVRADRRDRLHGCERVDYPHRSRRG